MTVRLAPSLLSADFARLADEVDEIQRGGADMLHLDLMDGHFVPNLTFGPPVVRALAPHCRIPMDAHLMVTDADPLVAELASAGVARVAVHVEACTHLHRTLDGIRQAGMVAGVALNPATPVGAVEEALAFCEFVLVMSVNPGFGGQRFIAESLDKIRRLARLPGAEDLEIEVDGGVDPDTAGELVAAGATTLVAGSAVFGSRDRKRALEDLRRAAERGKGETP
jgi:ribulose-phosphate 3-epimerase